MLPNGGIWYGVLYSVRNGLACAGAVPAEAPTATAARAAKAVRRCVMFGIGYGALGRHGCRSDAFGFCSQSYKKNRRIRQIHHRLVNRCFLAYAHAMEWLHCVTIYVILCLYYGQFYKL